LISLAATPWG